MPAKEAPSYQIKSDKSKTYALQVLAIQVNSLHIKAFGL